MTAVEPGTRSIDVKASGTETVHTFEALLASCGVEVTRRIPIASNTSAPRVAPLTRSSNIRGGFPDPMHRVGDSYVEFEKSTLKNDRGESVYS